MKFVHIVSASQNKDNVLESLKQSIFPVQKVYLVLCGNDLEVEAKDMEKTLKLVFEVDTIDVCQLDVGEIINELLKVINNEMDYGNMVLLNSTGSPEILDFTFHISAQTSGCKLYIGIPIEDGQGISEVLDIPVEPPKLIGDVELKIIKILHQEGVNWNP